MKIIVCVLTGLILSFSNNPVLAGSVNMEEGLWEITSKAEIPGMPFAMPEVKHTQCLTQEDLFPQGQSQMNQDCKMTTSDVTGNTASWTMVCLQQGMRNKTSGKITYNGTSFDGVMKTQASDPKGDGMMDMTTTMRGKHLGACK